MPDLLPPSPSAPTTNLKPFTTTSSGLKPYALPPEHGQSSLVMQSNGTSKAHAATLSALVNGESHPTHIDSHRRNPSITSNSPSPREILIRPLDFRNVMASHEDTHAELGRIVDDLIQLLSMTEAGFSELLNSAVEDRIDEEQEDLLLLEPRMEDRDTDSSEMADNSLALAVR
ncbi:hypothetical protein FA95DRAFT_244160 [Auriscalpium vulgare]|uniref:Uncharacterized protein n=1 Tax=Auriscalpium vulgare TaxID=40419 RepID=A0ACB8S569_9AGAM|nr:hypothetical protein FA95DRAFT_244160 [Auriscalpium vulgare]